MTCGEGWAEKKGPGDLKPQSDLLPHPLRAPNGPFSLQKTKTKKQWTQYNKTKHPEELHYPNLS